MTKTTKTIKENYRVLYFKRGSRFEFAGLYAGNKTNLSFLASKMKKFFDSSDQMAASMYRISGTLETIEDVYKFIDLKTGDNTYSYNENIKLLEADDDFPEGYKTDYKRKQF